MCHRVLTLFNPAKELNIDSIKTCLCGLNIL